MKQIFSLIAALLLPLCTFAQAPQAFSYQAIANNTNGTPVANGSVAVRISVLDNTATGTVLYTETHTKTTNAQGLFNLSIGQGAPTTGAFAAINWGANPKFVKVELDPAGGTNYTTVGTNQFQSVPYALYAEKVNPANIAENTVSISTKTGSMIVVYTSTNSYAFTPDRQGYPTWYTQSLSGNVIGAVASDSTIMVYTTTNAYAFTHDRQGYPTWYTQSISGNTIGTISTEHLKMVYTATNAYAFTHDRQGYPTWYTQSLSGNVIGATNTGTKAIVYTATNAYAFTPDLQGYPTWYRQSLSGNVIGAVPK